MQAIMQGFLVRKQVCRTMYVGGCLTVCMFPTRALIVKVREAKIERLERAEEAL